VNILVVVPYFDEPHRWMISGQKTAYELSKQHQVVVLTTGPKTDVVAVNKSLKVYRLRDIFLRDPINYSIIPGLFRAVRTIVKQEKPEVVLINKHMFFSSLAIWPLKRMGKRVIMQIDTFPGINWFPKSKLVGAIMWLYARVIGNPILRAANNVVLLHEGLVPVAKKLGLTYSVIHNGVDLKKIDQAECPTDLVKPKGEIWVGYVGRLESVKGWYDLAEVAQRLVTRYPRVKWVFVGHNQAAHSRISVEFNHPNLKFLGQRSDVLGIYKLMDIFVLPSYSEGLPNALMEAMANRLCCLASNVGGVQRLIKDNQSGLLFQPGNQEQLRKQLERALTNDSLRVKLGKAARRTIEKEYDLHKTTKQLSDLLNNYAH
jgi:glycosyltransferase involved in cell wall biosynthesis